MLCNHVDDMMTTQPCLPFDSFSIVSNLASCCPEHGWSSLCSMVGRSWRLPASSVAKSSLKGGIELHNIYRLVSLIRSWLSVRCWNQIQSNRVRFSLNCGADWDTESACTLRQRRGERTEDTAEEVAENCLRKLEPLEYMGPRSCSIRVSCKVVVMIGGLKDNLQRRDEMVRKVIDNLYTWCLLVS